MAIAVGRPISVMARPPVAGGINLIVHLKKGLALHMDLNVLFDPESRLKMRGVPIDVRNISRAEANSAIRLQEGLVLSSKRSSKKMRRGIDDVALRPFTDLRALPKPS